MTTRLIPIGRSEGGILQTLEAMRQEATEAPLWEWSVAPRSVEAWIMERFDYVENVRMEFRTIHRMVSDYQSTGRFTGACADAAVLAVWLLGPSIAGGNLGAWLAAVRRPHAVGFTHVFVRALDPYGMFQIDPTAAGNDYRQHEFLSLPL